jgi:hypothetical protein
MNVQTEKKNDELRCNIDAIRKLYESLFEENPNNVHPHKRKEREKKDPFAAGEAFENSG